MRSRIALAALFAVALVVAACADLLPQSKIQTDTQWATFDEARAMVLASNPHTTKQELARIGVSELNPGVTLLSHVEIAVRFPIGGVLNESDVDRGVRDCLKAGKGCSGYQLSVKRINSDRVGDFWLDTFRFRRETASAGWTFTALILFVDDRAVYAVYGGQPNFHETQVDRNPLGPLQGWGDWVSGQIYK
jgi:hypothetical protein